MSVGKKTWVIAEGYIPPDDSSKERSMISHETACILNANKCDATVRLTIFYSDREPAGPYSIEVKARRTLHLRFNDLTEPEAVPAGTDYSSVFEPDVPVVVQHSRLDGRTAQNALLTTVAYSE